jgi:hypothetical protein
MGLTDEMAEKSRVSGASMVTKWKTTRNNIAVLAFGTSQIIALAERVKEAMTTLGIKEQGEIDQIISIAKPMQRPLDAILDEVPDNGKLIERECEIDKGTVVLLAETTARTEGLAERAGEFIVLLNMQAKADLQEIAKTAKRMNFDVCSVMDDNQTRS